MDPLSIIASSIAIAHVIRLGLQKAQQFNHGKSDMLALSNEISDLSVVLQAIERSFEQESHVIRDDTQIIQSILPIRARLQLIAVEVENWLGNSSISPHLVEANRLFWLRIGSKAKRLKDDVHSLRSQLVTTLAAVSAIKSSRVELDLEGVYLVTQDVVSGQQQVSNLVKDNHLEQLRCFEDISAAIRSLRTQRSLQPCIQLRHETDSMSAPAMSSETSVPRSPHIKAFHHNGAILFESSQMTAISAVGIRTAQFPRMPCKPWCSCLCHEEMRLKSPSFLERVVGSLFIGYSGMPTQRRPCNEQSCRLAAQPLLYVTYYFPGWFLARMICFSWTTTPMAGPVASLKVQRLVPKNADIFKCAMTGNVDRMKYLFENGLASPHDVSYLCGSTPLHVAIRYQQMDACRLLLQANADPFIEDRSHWTPTDNAWTFLLGRKWKPETERQLRLMFNDAECLERRDFSMIHRIVLGLVGKDLETELEASTADINTVDANGVSPLSFASGRADVESTKTLLRYGADPNLASQPQGVPLHKAACALHPTCIPLLLSHGAIVDAKTSWNQTPLHFAAAFAHDSRHATLLLAAGADPNSRDLDGITPLQWAANSANTHVASVLLAHGADPSPEPDRFGIDPLVQCVVSNRHEILAMLLKYSLDATRPMPQGESLLHIVARHADAETMRLLRSLDLSDLDFHKISENGLTAHQILEVRDDVPQELSDEFRLLVSSQSSDITAPVILEAVVEDDNEEEDIWVDAAEVHAL